MLSIVRDVQYLAGALLRAGVLDERRQAPQRRPHRGEAGRRMPVWHAVRVSHNKQADTYKMVGGERTCNEV